MVRQWPRASRYHSQLIKAPNKGAVLFKIAAKPVLMCIKA
jgi:hypothetical protein